MDEIPSSALLGVTEGVAAVAFDASNDTLYVDGIFGNVFAIFSLKLSSVGLKPEKKLLVKTYDEIIMGMAFDPVEQTLYWTNFTGTRIYKMRVDGESLEPTVFLDLNGTIFPQSVAIDVCGRQLYWSSVNHATPSIERMPLNGSGKSEVLVDTNLVRPKNIVIDQQSKRFYWSDAQDGHEYFVESAELDGSNRKIIHNDHSADSSPTSVVIDESNLFWTDNIEGNIWKIAKNASSSEAPLKIRDFGDPFGLLFPTYMIVRRNGNADCASV